MDRGLSLLVAALGVAQSAGCGGSDEVRGAPDATIRAPDASLVSADSGSGDSSVPEHALPESSATTDSGIDVIGASVLQHHLHANRDGAYVEPALTRTAAQTMHMDPTFTASVQGPTYAQPLYVENGPNGREVLLIVTEQNIVYALDSSNGSTVWQTTLGDPPALATFACGGIDPLGITGTPVIDLGSRSIYLDAMTTPDGSTHNHKIFALSIDDGSTRTGWPLDVDAVVTNGQTQFDSSVENQRSALALFDNTLYVPYGGLAGDCGAFHGWVVGIPLSNSGAPGSWVTSAVGGGIWGVGGIASDGTSLYVATGNTYTGSTWSDGEGIIRLQAGPTFSGLPQDYFTPSDWKNLDNLDLDLGGSGPLPIDVPGATPSAMIVALGKNGVAYLLDRNNLGGLGTGNGVTGEGVTSSGVVNGSIINAAATYQTAQGSYVVLGGTAQGNGCPNGSGGDVVALKISPTNPPTINVAWCAQSLGRGSPIVTTTDGMSEAIVWIVSAEGTEQLYGFDGDTGDIVFDGGAATDVMSLVRRFTTPIAVNGRIFVGADNQVYAFTP